MLVSSTTSAMLANAAKLPTNVPVMIVPRYGVLNRGCTLEKNGGRSPSRDMDMKMRGCPSWKTSNTLVIANTAPRETMNRETEIRRGEPSANASAVIIGSAVPSLGQGAIPVITPATTTYTARCR